MRRVLYSDSEAGDRLHEVSRDSLSRMRSIMAPVLAMETPKVSLYIASARRLVWTQQRCRASAAAPPYPRNAPAHVAAYMFCATHQVRLGVLVTPTSGSVILLGGSKHANLDVAFDELSSVTSQSVTLGQSSAVWRFMPRKGTLPSEPSVSSVRWIYSTDLQMFDPSMESSEAAVADWYLAMQTTEIRNSAAPEYEQQRQCSAAAAGNWDGVNGLVAMDFGMNTAPASICNRQPSAECAEHGEPTYDACSGAMEASARIDACFVAWSPGSTLDDDGCIVVPSCLEPPVETPVSSVGTCCNPVVHVANLEATPAPSGDGNFYLCECWRLCRRIPSLEAHWTAPPCVLPLRCTLEGSKAQSAFLRQCTGLPTKSAVADFSVTLMNPCGWQFQYSYARQPAPNRPLQPIGNRIESAKGSPRFSTIKRALKLLTSASPTTLYAISVHADGMGFSRGSGCAADGNLNPK
jgi:hypothetical protein